MPSPEVSPTGDDIELSVFSEDCGPFDIDAAAYSVLDELEEQKGLLSVKEAAALFNIGPQKIYKMVASKKLPALRFDGMVKLDPKALSYWVRKQHPAFAAASREDVT